MFQFLPISFLQEDIFFCQDISWDFPGWQRGSCCDSIEEPPVPFEGYWKDEKNDSESYHIQQVLKNILESKGRKVADGGEKWTVKAELGLDDEEEPPWAELGGRHAGGRNSMCKVSEVGKNLACGWSGQS